MVQEETKVSLVKPEAVMTTPTYFQSQLLVCFLEVIIACTLGHTQYRAVELQERCLISLSVQYEGGFRVAANPLSRHGQVEAGGLTSNLYPLEPATCVRVKLG